MAQDHKYITEFRASLEASDIASLRQRASKNFGIKLTREHSKSDIIELIISAMNKSNYADTADGELKPGYARIKLIPFAGNKAGFPVYINCNGYTCYIPIGVEVDVPIKVIEVLEHAEEMKKTQNEFDEYVNTLSLSYPFSVIQINKGPDPKPGREAATERKWEPYRQFQKKFGFWPSARRLEQATASSMQFNQYQEQE